MAVSGGTAVGILMTLHNKRAIASAVGSLLRRELSTGLRDGDGSGPQGPTESLCHSVTSPFEKGGLFISGSAAVGILKTLHKKREIDTTRGSFLGKERPVGRVHGILSRLAAPYESRSLATPPG